MLNYSLEPSKPQIMFRIEDIQQFENEVFRIFSMIHLFLLTIFEKKKRSRKNRENMLNYAAKRQRRS